jgi:predicted RNA methylase
MTPHRALRTLLAVGAIALGGCARTDPEAPARPDTGSVGTVQGSAESFASACLPKDITVLPGVFRPDEAEALVVPLLRQHSELFAGRAVLEIGTGSGLIGLCAAELGAAHVVVTDINPEAVECARRNAESLGLAATVDARLVPERDPSAFSVIGRSEAFDVILSNPPYSLDLDAPRDTAVVENGDLGFSILRGLPTHLRPRGVCLLLYNSFFFHNVMVRYARQLGYDVRHQSPDILSPWETEALFNSYLERLLAAQGEDPRAFRFDWRQENFALFAPSQPQPLLADYPTGSYPGMIVIRQRPSPPR